MNEYNETYISALIPRQTHTYIRNFHQTFTRHFITTLGTKIQTIANGKKKEREDNFKFVGHKNFLYWTKLLVTI